MSYDLCSCWCQNWSVSSSKSIVQTSHRDGDKWDDMEQNAEKLKSLNFIVFVIMYWMSTKLKEKNK